MDGYHANLFLDGYLRYHQISITLEDRYNMTFVSDEWMVIWWVLPFGVKDGPRTFPWEVTNAFYEYLDYFMNIFLNDFIMHNDMKTHVDKFRLCFQKCNEFWINSNPKKCAFMEYSKIILWFIISKKGNYWILRKYMRLLTCQFLKSTIDPNV